MVGYYLARTQLRNRALMGGWSVSGRSLTFVFPMCGLMHIAFVLYAAAGTYTVDTHGLVIDWLAVPGALYFVWVVRSTIYCGPSTTGTAPAPGVCRSPSPPDRSDAEAFGDQGQALHGLHQRHPDVAGAGRAVEVAG